VTRVKFFNVFLFSLFLALALSGCVPSTKSGVTIKTPLSSLSITPVSSTNPFLEKEVNTTTQGIFTVMNTGQGDVLSLKMSSFSSQSPFSFKDDSKGTCFNYSRLAPGASCTLIVTFIPTDVGVFKEDLVLSYNNGAIMASTAYTLNAVAGDLGLLGFVNHSSPMGVVAPGGTLEKTIIIQNTGHLTAKNIVASFAAATLESQLGYIGFKGGFFPGVGGTCSTTILGLETCTVVVSFSPPANATLEVLHKYTLKFEYIDPINPTIFSLSLEAVCDEVGGKFRPDDGSTSLSFDVTLQGKIKTKMINFVNDGFLSTTLTSIDISTPFSASSTGTCMIGSAMEVNDSCYINFDYAPTASQAIGTVTASVTFNFDSGIGSRSTTIIFTGTSLDPANLIFSKDSVVISSYDFGQVGTGQTKTATVSIENIGSYDASKTTYSTINSPFALYSKGACSATRLAGSKCQIKVQFVPTSIGTFSEASAFSVSYFDGVKSATMTLDLMGEGIASGFLSLNQTSEYLDDGTYQEWSNIPVSYIGFVNNATFTPLDSSSLLYFDFARSQVFENKQILLKVENKGLGPIYNLNIPLASVVSTTFYNYFGAPVTSYPFTDPVLLGKPIYRLPSTAGTDCYDRGTVFDMPIGDFCYITLLYAPSTAASEYADITFPYEVGASFPYEPRTLHYRFLGTSTNKSFLSEDTDLTFLDFGTLSYVANVKKMLTIKNSGNRDADFTTGSISDTTYFSFDYLSTFPGINPTLSALNPCDTVLRASGNQPCNVMIRVLPTSPGPLTATFSLPYSDELGTEIFNFPLNVIGGDYAYIKYADSTYYSYNSAAPAILPSVAAGGSSSMLSIPIKNEGGGPACNITCEIPTFLTVGDPCPSSLAVAETATFTVYFQPPSVGIFTDRIKILYDQDCNGSVDQGIGNYLQGSAFPPAVIVNKQDGIVTSQLNFGIQAIDSITSTNAVVANVGTFAATNIAYSFGAGASSRFSITALGTTCPNSGADTLNVGANCSLKISFTPTEDDVSATVTDTLNISYFNGAASKTATLTLTGQGEPPAASFDTWTEIYAVGRVMKYVAGGSPIVGIDDAKIRLAWKTMTVPTGYSIVNYGIWKKYKLADAYAADPDFEIMASSCGTTCSLSDNPVNEATVVYYKVRPYVRKTSSGKNLGYAPVTQAWSQIRVITPPLGMAYVNRWMANIDFCQRWRPTEPIVWELDSSTGTLTNYHPTCAYRAAGSTNHVYDIGYDLFVDRLEVSGTAALPQNYMGVSPQKVSQASAQASCKNFSNVTIAGITYTKRLMSHKEFLAAASWPSTLTDVEIAAAETASTSTTKCNGSGTAAENTGSNIDCVSRYGIYDLVGNVHEWQSDRISSKTGVIDNALRLVLTNTDMDNISVSGVASSYIADGLCFAPALGLLLPKIGATCGTDELVPSGYATKLHNDYYTAPSSSSLMGIFSGGAYNAAVSGALVSGAYMTGWTPVTTTIGFRCVYEVPYPLE